MSFPRSLDIEWMAAKRSPSLTRVVIMVFRLLILAKSPDTVKVTKVKGHATEALVEQGRVRLEDMLRNPCGP